MIDHPLVKYAKRYSTPIAVPTPQGCRYDTQAGYWVMCDSGQPMMTSDSAVMPITKKYDRETGEDMKGE